MALYLLRIFVVVTLFSSCGRQSDGTVSSKVENTSPDPITFIPAGFELLDSVSGNLDNDNLKDFLLICRPIGEDTLSIAEDSLLHRKMLILKASAGNQYTLAAQSENAVYCYSCGGMYGDPYAGLQIDAPTFTIAHYGGAAERWTRSLTFTYEPGTRDWFLTKDESKLFDALNTDSVEVETKTPADFGKITFSNFNIYL
jgi:hypothetical protein